VLLTIPFWPRWTWSGTGGRGTNGRCEKLVNPTSEAWLQKQAD